MDRKEGKKDVGKERKRLQCLEAVAGESKWEEKKKETEFGGKMEAGRFGGILAGKESREGR